MIDIWMIVSMMFLFFEVSLHSCKAVLTKPKKKTNKGESVWISDINASSSVVQLQPSSLKRFLGSDEK